MLNQNTTSKRASTPARDITTFWAWRGYCDRANGLDFTADYDTLGPGNQRNYERGRQVAATFLGVRGAAPKWRKSETLLRLAMRTNMYFQVDQTVRLFFSKHR